MYRSANQSVLTPSRVARRISQLAVRINESLNLTPIVADCRAVALTGLQLAVLLVNVPLHLRFHQGW